MKEDIDSIGTLVPRPDPTLLTTAQLQVAIAALKELMEEKIASTNRLKEEKFKETWDRLDLMEKQRLETKVDSDKAIERALAAQERLFAQKNACNEEAANKAEASFTKQIEALKSEAAITTKAIYDRIDTQNQRDKGQSNWIINTAISCIAVIVAIGAVVVVLLK